ncbi:MAG: single-stranded DNA-binding protein [Zetaproteobacteria bacterium CG2_30_46_52]|nr:MAG: single-stranded DNA-binding protein [Zetaproteobacteria bacterium CG2_30_46_52]
MNVYSFTGRLGRDSEQRFAQNGTAICSFTVAVDYGYGDNKGTNWVRCSLFGKRAEGGLPQYLKKGAQVAINGELRIREYDDKDGNKRTSVEVNVDNLDLIGGRDGGGQSGGGNQGGGYQQGGGSRPAAQSDPFADQPDFNSAPVDDDIPF